MDDRKIYAPTPSVPHALITMASWAWRVIAVAAATALLVWILSKFSFLLIALLVTLLIAVVFAPLNSWCRSVLHFPPAAAAAVTLLTVVLILGAIIGGSSTGIYQGFTALAANVQNGIETLLNWLTQRFPAAENSVDELWNNTQNFLKNNARTIVGGVLNAGSSISEFFAGCVLTFFALFFFLKDGRQLWHWCVRLLPVRYRDDANEAGIRAWVTLGNYARTQAVVALVDATGIAVFAACLKTPFSLVVPIAALVFIGAFIPIVGALLSGSVAILVVLVNTSSILMALIMLGGVILVQQLEGHVLQPLLQGNALNLHALAIVLLVTGGTTLAGIPGALFTVPLAAAINAIVLYLRGHDIYPYLETLENRPGGPKRPFEEYSAEYWEHFDKTIAQHLPPKLARKHATHQSLNEIKRAHQRSLEEIARARHTATRTFKRGASDTPAAATSTPPTQPAQTSASENEAHTEQ